MMSTTHALKGGWIIVNIITAQELGKYLKFSDSTVYKLALQGELPGFKIGDSWRFDMDEVINHIRAKKEAIGARSVSTKEDINGGERR